MTDLAHHSEDNFKEIYHQYFQIAAKTSFYILKNQEAAEDVAQDVFVKLWHKKSELSEIENIKAYIAQVSRNAALDVLKQSSFDEEPLELVEKVDLAERPDNSEQIRERLQEVVAQLSPQCRLVFSLSRFEGLTNEEIAEYLDISKRTVETQISLALKRFRTDLKHAFIDLLFLIAFFSQLL